jgi:hypothetical protein
LTLRSPKSPMPEPRTRDPRRLLRRRSDRRGAWFRWWSHGCQLRHAAGQSPARWKTRRMASSPGGRLRKSSFTSAEPTVHAPRPRTVAPGSAARALGVLPPCPGFTAVRGLPPSPPRHRLDTESSGGRRACLTGREGPIESGVQFVCGMDPGGRGPSARGLR